MIQRAQGHTALSRRRTISGIQEKIGQINGEAISPKLLRLACQLVLGGLLVAGLWPFHSPRNQVTWFAGGNGVHFSRHGTILSSGKFRAANVPADGPCSLEIWIEPDRTAGGGTLFAFYAPDNPRQFSLDQSITDLELRSGTRHGRFRTLTNRLYVGDIFRRGKPLFITITSKGSQTSVFIDGALVETASKFPLSSRDFVGELIIATLPKIDDCWSGLLRGLAFYHQELSPAQVLHHYQTWTGMGRPDISQNERAVALYLFDEHNAHVIHNHIRSGPDLYIPDRYLVLDQALFLPFWEEFQPTWGYSEDVLVNIVGFVPFGFLFCAYFSLATRIKGPALVTILLGFIISLTIESLQSFLPTRDSGTTDLFTNTLGACLGVWLYRWDLWRVLLARIYSSLNRVEAKL
jgi:hypothetical protein